MANEAEEDDMVNDRSAVLLFQLGFQRAAETLAELSSF